MAWVYAGYPAAGGDRPDTPGGPSSRPRTRRRSRSRSPSTTRPSTSPSGSRTRSRRPNSGARIVEVLVGSDGSTDATDAIVAELAAADPRIRGLTLPRRGQTATQAALFAAARGEVVVLTDAETRFAPGCLAALAEALRDPRVGCVTGRLEWRDEAATATSAQEGLYWRYERRVRELESRAGLLTAVTGALLAVRGSAYRPVPPTASMDHLLPLYVREAGGPRRLRPGRGRHGSADQRPARAVPQPHPDRDPRDPGQPVDGRAARAVAPTRARARDLVAQAAALGDAVVRRGRSGERPRARHRRTRWATCVARGRGAPDLSARPRRTCSSARAVIRGAFWRSPAHSPSSTSPSRPAGSTCSAVARSRSGTGPNFGSVDAGTLQT